MSKTAPNLFIPSAYSVWTAAFGTSAPTTPTATPSASWYEVGYLSDQGITEGRNINESKIYDLVGQLLATARNQEERPFTFQAMEDNRVVRELRYPGSTQSTGAGTAEVQTATITGTPTGGTFTLTGGYGTKATTSALAYNATGATVQTAVQALPGLSAATVAGSAGGPYTVTYPASLGNVDPLTVDASLLTGGTSPGVTIATTTPGVAPVNTRVVGSGTGQNLRAWLVYIAKGSKHKLFVISNGEATQTGTVGYTGTGAAVSEFTLQPYPDPTTGAFFTLLDDDPAQNVTYS